MITARFNLLELLFMSEKEGIVEAYANAYKEARATANVLFHVMDKDAILEAGVVEHSFNRLTSHRLRHTFEKNDTTLFNQKTTVEFTFNNKQEQCMFLIKWA